MKLRTSLNKNNKMKQCILVILLIPALLVQIYQLVIGIYVLNKLNSRNFIGYAGLVSCIAIFIFIVMFLAACQSSWNRSQVVYYCILLFMFCQAAVPFVFTAVYEEIDSEKHTPTFNQNNQDTLSTMILWAMIVSYPLLLVAFIALIFWFMEVKKEIKQTRAAAAGVQN